MYRLERISYKVNKDKTIDLIELKKGEYSNKCVFTWTKEFSPKINMKALAKKVIEVDKQAVLCYNDGTEDDPKYSLGISGSIYHTLKAQGIIIETEPTVTI